MATKSTTITDEAYNRLASFKEGKDSFSDVVNKLTNKSSLFDLIGLLSNPEADKLERNIADSRKRMRKGMNETAKKLQRKSFNQKC